MKIQSYMPQSQSMIFSATVPKYIQEIAREYMKDPLMIDLVGEDTTQMPDTISNEIVLCQNRKAKLQNIRKFVNRNP